MTSKRPGGTAAVLFGGKIFALSRNGEILTQFSKIDLSHLSLIPAVYTPVNISADCCADRHSSGRIKMNKKLQEKHNVRMWLQR